MDSREIVLVVENKCKSNNDTVFIELAISGLLPFKTYKITVLATNELGFSSAESEEVIVNTFEAPPRFLSPLITKSVLNYEGDKSGYGIIFKFNDPLQLNGILKKFNLFLFNQSSDLTDDNAIFYDYQLELIYTGLQRDFHLSKLLPYKYYYFLYEMCTAAGCTRETKLTRVLTLEGPPFDQPSPTIIKDKLNFHCFKIEIKNPYLPNGVMLFFELFRIEKIHPLNPFDKERLIKNITANGSFIYSLNDCDLKPNIIYSYKVVSHNAKGSASSNFSSPVFSSQLLPEGLSPINVVQTSDTNVKIEWKRPISPNGLIAAYNIYRNSELITNSTLIRNFSLADELSFIDNYDFLPKTSYNYTLYACNEAGCSTDETNYSVSILISDQPPLSVSKPKLLTIRLVNLKFKIILSLQNIFK